MKERAHLVEAIKALRQSLKMCSEKCKVSDVWRVVSAHSWTRR
jgi:hypothetical protein